MLTGFYAQPLLPGERFPLLLQPAKGYGDLADLFAREKDALDARLLEHGALLFRGFDVRTSERFDHLVRRVSERRVDYTYRSTPRKALGQAIYTATEYPPDREIPLHNENAYQSTWPLRLAFACVIPAAAGGETPIADMRRVGAAIGADVMASFEERKVRYTRHYHPNVDLSWQEVFQTEDRSVLAAFCEANGISHEWIDESTLKTVQVCQGTARHPVTNERVFFNQAHLFHVSSLGGEMEDIMIEAFGADRLPRHATYGDGREIEPDALTVIREAFQSCAVSFPWQAGDVLLLDNMQVAHGRRPFSGERKVFAALLDPYSVV